ncbi:PFL family protein [Methanohalophilus sp. RSK]|uniref:PFL family protein n=1 Tax=Methanohalophilus sp. RSK TaxID=2485783 RepID=UPI000F43CA8D|nr:PFL family protein [Methanohalophilus sp. RSK]RNI15060.1 PFL family protein [Methanohalophilus sp. RSK]
MFIHPEEIMETIHMISSMNLDIRTVTMGINLRDCVHPDIETFNDNIHEKMTRCASKLVDVADEVEQMYGIPIINKRISVTPIATIAETYTQEEIVSIAKTLDRAANEIGVDFIGGFTALVHKGMTAGDRRLINAIPEALAVTEKVCSSVNVATTKAGINMNAVKLMGKVIKETADLTRDREGIGCAKLVVFANAPEDNPFMAGAFHGVGEADCVINVGVSGPGVVNSAIRDLNNPDLGEIAECIKKTAFKITRMGEMTGREVSRRLEADFGVVDLSLAPTPEVGDSVAAILEAMGLESCGTHGTTAALALLNDAVKKGGAMASSSVGGLSGAFIPVSEDAGMIEAVKRGSLKLDKLEAMTSVCSVGLDMIAVPGDTPSSTISAIMADEMAVGMINRKTTAVRIITAPGKKTGDMVEYGGLLGSCPVMPVHKFSSEEFVKKAGRIPAPIQALTN